MTENKLDRLMQLAIQQEALKGKLLIAVARAVVALGREVDDMGASGISPKLSNQLSRIGTLANELIKFSNSNQKSFDDT